MLENNTDAMRQFIKTCGEDIQKVSNDNMVKISWTTIKTTKKNQQQQEMNTATTDTQQLIGQSKLTLN